MPKKRIDKKLYKEAVSLLKEYARNKQILKDYEEGKTYISAVKLSVIPKSNTNNVSRPTEILAMKDKPLEVIQAEKNVDIVNLALASVSPKAKLIFEEFYCKKNSKWSIINNPNLFEQINSERHFLQ